MLSPCFFFQLVARLFSNGAIWACAGLTKMISKLSKEGAFRKGLEVFHALPELGITYDTTITNAAISACDKGAQLLFHAAD